MWKSLSITQKILISLGILGTGYLISTIAGFVTGIHTEKKLHMVSDLIFPASQQSQLALSAFDEQVKLYKDAVILGEASGINLAQEKADTVRKALESTINHYDALDKEQAGNIRETLALHDRFTALAKIIYTKMSSGNNTSETMEQVASLSKQVKAIRGRLESYSRMNSQSLKIQLSDIGSDTRHQRYANLIIFCAVAGSSIFLVLVIVTVTIRKPLKRTISMIRDIAEGEGDLTKRLEVMGSDEVGELAMWFNTFIDRLEKLIAGIRQTAVDVDGSSQVVSSEAQGLSQAAQEQAAAIEELASTIQQIVTTINNNAEYASGGYKMTKDIVRLADNSSKLSKDLLQAIKSVSDISNKIGNITHTVNEVAFQTNLLALNAAVEAARAGEHGKGFAVVAQEVKELAKRSSVASMQIKELIEDTVNKIILGDSMVQKSVDGLSEIITCIKELSHTMEEITASSSEQVIAIDQVNKAISQIDQMTQINASSVEQLASTSDSMSTGAAVLMQDVANFRVSPSET